LQKINFIEIGKNSITTLNKWKKKRKIKIMDKFEVCEEEGSKIDKKAIFKVMTCISTLFTRRKTKMTMMMTQTIKNLKMSTLMLKTLSTLTLIIQIFKMIRQA
jgi:nicotinic acid mononucleotide adenylyltransferase